MLNKHPNVSEKTKTTVNNVMQELNYYPHQIARALSKKQSFLIGMLVPDCANPFFAELIKYVELHAQKHDYKLLLCNSLNNKEKELKYIAMLQQNRVDGIIMGSHTLDVDFYKNLNAPIITFDRYIDENSIHVPKDLKIIGYDHNSFIRMLKTPRITTIAQPAEKLANALWDGLLQLIENPKTHNVHN